MNKKILLIAVSLLIAGCTSPSFYMPDEQIRQLSDDQVCKYKNNYRDETKLENEIMRRNLNCDRFYRKCLAQGNQPGTKAMDFCIDILRQNENLRYDNDRPYGGFGWGGRSGIGVYNSFPLYR